MAVVSMKQLLEAGVHFGHQTRRWNPKMARFIFTERNGIYIIDLQKTVKKVEEAYAFLREVAATGAPILFVGTKKQAQNSVKEEATRCNQFYVNERWLGGMLTNFRTIQTRIARLKELEKMFEEGTTDQYPKKEVILMKRELEKLEKNLGGIKDMKKIPGALFIIDSKKEEIAIAEAHKLHIPVIATVDTNCDPDVVDFPIPANDDAIRAVRLLASKMADAVLEGRQGQQEAEAAKEVKAEVKEEKKPAAKTVAAKTEPAKTEVKAEAKKPAAKKPAAKKPAVAKTTETVFVEYNKIEENYICKVVVMKAMYYICNTCTVAKRGEEYTNVIITSVC